MHNPDVIQPTDPPPVSEPDLMERNQDGLYVITIPGMMSTGSDAVLIGSGETGSGGGLMTGSESPHLEVYVVRVSWHGNHTYFPLVSCSSSLFMEDELVNNSKSYRVSSYTLQHKN